MYELLEKGDITKRDLPLFLSLWLDVSYEQCMYSPSHLQWWTSLHLKTGAWYLDCPLECTPYKEVELKNSITSRSTEVAVDEFLGLDEDARAKAVKRREEADKKIALKNSEAVSKAKEKMTKKALKALENEEASTAKKGKGKQQVQTLVARDAASQHQHSASRGTKRDADYMSLSDGDVVADPLPQVYHDIIKFIDEHSGNKKRFFTGVRSDKPRIDLIIADLPEGLPVPDLSVPANNIPKWNADNPVLLESVFEFADGHLHDDGALIIIYPLKAITKATIVKYGTTYSFEKIKDWWGTNWLHLASLVPASQTTQVFGIALFMRNLLGIGKSKFKFQPSPSLLGLGVNVPRDDILQNFTKRETLMMDNNSKPWRGAKEKDPRFFQMLIESCSLANDVVLDCTAATGASVHACRILSRQIVELEEDKAIFDAIFSPMIHPIPSEPPSIAEAPLHFDMNSHEPSHRTFFTLPGFFPSPEKSYILPSYAEALTSSFACQPTFPTRKKSRSLNCRVLQFVDVTALESDTETSLTDSSSHSQSMST